MRQAVDPAVFCQDAIKQLYELVSGCRAAKARYQPVFVTLPPGGGFSIDALVFATALAAAALAAGNLVHDRWGI